jgi:predicted exporter
MTKGWRWFVWAFLIVLCGLQIQRTTVVTDVSSFLPSAANADQRLMVEQLRNGLSTRIVLIGLRVNDAPPNGLSEEQSIALVAASKTLRARLVANKQFAWVLNGDITALALERERLFSARYLLSSNVNDKLFSESGLKESFKKLELELISSRGALIKPLAAADPTLETLQVLDGSSRQIASPADKGVWLGANGSVALFLLETAAKGDQIAQLREAISSAKVSAEEVLKDWPKNLKTPSIEFAGSGYFNVMSHDAIGKDSERLSVIALSLVGLLLLVCLRSPRFLAVASVPVLTGALAGFAAVGWVNGTIHGITLAFGVTLIGEAVDYAIYTYIQRDDDGAHSAQFWRQISLAVSTSLLSFAAMYFSGFQGLRQLGLFSAVGLVVAAACTRWLLPSVLPTSRGMQPSSSVVWALRFAERMPRTRWLFLGITAAALLVLVQHRNEIWRDNLDSLSASSQEETARDIRYRAAIGVPDLRTMISIRAASLEATLLQTEATTRILDSLITAGTITGYDSPSTVLPSKTLQRQRQMAIPTEPELRANVTAALLQANMKAQAFEPFISDVQNARSMPLMDIGYFDNTIVGRWLNSQIVQSADGFNALILIHGVASAEVIKQKLSASKLNGVSLIDLRQDVEILVASYREKAMNTALLGALGIIFALIYQLRRVQAVISMVSTLVCTVVVTTATVLLVNGYLNVFNLVSLLLVVGVASNYTLFFATLSSNPQERQRATLSVMLAASATFIGFATLAFSTTPVLATIGLTVSVGAVVGLIASMVFSAISQ